MTNNENIGFALTPELAEQFFERCIEAEKKMGPLSREEKIVILKTLASPITLGELLDAMAGQRVLAIGFKPPEPKGTK